MAKGKRSYYELRVVSSIKITPGMQRVTLTGSDLANFPEGQESGYIKLYFNQAGEALKYKPEPDPTPETKPMLRTYTIRQFDSQKREMVVDFVLHGEKGHSGPAANWASTAKEGDPLVISGPGATKLVDNKADWFLIAGDMTALPAISCNLEQLPDHAKGYAVIEIQNEADKQSIKTPEGIEIHWLVNPKPGVTSNTLLDRIKTLPWLNGRPSIWAACEFNSMRALRQFFKNEKQLSSKDIYISSYWKNGLNEERHKVEKRKDAQEALSAA